MKKYSFLFKPVFFIFSLLFATWLVVEIEKISPSDFGKSESYVNPKPNSQQDCYDRKQYLKNLCSAYKMGIIDSTMLEEKLTLFLNLPPNAPIK